MILLFGGTSETAGLATTLAQNGHAVLVSTATDAELDVGSHPAIERRCGRLDQEAMVQLFRQRKIKVVIDASHPYAVELHATVAAAAQLVQIPCFRYQRKATEMSEKGNISFVDDHYQAAGLAAKMAVPVLLTTGSRQLAPYIDLLKKNKIPLYARVLPHPESERACDLVGLPQQSRIVGRGPFSEAENQELISSKKIGVLITKDSGPRGGVAEKIAAAKSENCHVIVVQRPVEEQGYCQVFEDVELLFTVVNDLCQGQS